MALRSDGEKMDQPRVQDVNEGTNELDRCSKYRMEGLNHSRREMKSQKA